MVSQREEGEKRGVVASPNPSSTRDHSIQRHPVNTLMMNEWKAQISHIMSPVIGEYYIVHYYISGKAKPTYSLAFSGESCKTVSGTLNNNRYNLAICRNLKGEAVYRQSLRPPPTPPYPAKGGMDIGGLLKREDRCCC
jgi:hypothetical protein